jgi:hypothetical protein
MNVPMEDMRAPDFVNLTKPLFESLKHRRPAGCRAAAKVEFGSGVAAAQDWFDSGKSVENAVAAE